MRPLVRGGRVKRKSEMDDKGDAAPKVDEDVVQELRDQQDYLQDWMNVAQRHMMAMRMYVEDQDDDFGKYLDMAEDNQR
jgi:hypothetical protein